MTWADLDKLAAAKPRPDGSPTLVVRDDRSPDQMLENRHLSILVAIARIVRARRVLADRHAGAGTVVYLTSRPPPPALIDAVTAAGGVVFDGTREHVARAPLATTLQLDGAFSDLGSAVRRRLGARTFTDALDMLEWEIKRKRPERTQIDLWWTAIIELAAVTGECIRENTAGRWIEAPAHRLPLALDLGKGNVLLPGQLAQTIVEGGDASMRSLLELTAPPTITPIRPGATVMPLLCDRRAVPIEQLTWERLIAAEVDTDDMPVIVYVEDHGGIIKWPFGPNEPTDAQRSRALANLAKEPFEIDVFDARGHTVATVTGGFYGAEALLVPAVMARVSSQLGGPQMMLVGVPARGHLVAVDAVKANLDDTFQQLFLMLVEKHYFEATERDRISYEVIVYLDKPLGRVQSNLMDVRRMMRASGVDPDAPGD